MHLKKHGVYHGDLKSKNILVVSKPQDQIHVVITDFGMAKLKNKSVKTLYTINMKGTVIYLSTEMITQH